MQLIRNDVILDETSLTIPAETVVNLSQLQGVAVHAVFIVTSGPADATIKLQASNDGLNFADLCGASYHITASGNVIFNCTDPFFKWLKVVYTPVAGTVTLQVILAADDGKQ